MAKCSKYLPIIIPGYYFLNSKYNKINTCNNRVVIKDEIFTCETATNEFIKMNRLNI